MDKGNGEAKQIPAPPADSIQRLTITFDRTTGAINCECSDGMATARGLLKVAEELYENMARAAAQAAMRAAMPDIVVPKGKIQL